MIICSTKKKTPNNPPIYIHIPYINVPSSRKTRTNPTQRIYIYILSKMIDFDSRNTVKKKQLETTTTNGYSSYCHWTRADRGKETFRREKPYLSQWRGGLPGRCRILDVNVPRGNAVDGFVSGVTPPQALYQHCRGRYLSIEVFLPLLLLHLQRETGAQYSLEIRRYFV